LELWGLRRKLAISLKELEKAGYRINGGCASRVVRMPESRMGREEFLSRLKGKTNRRKTNGDILENKFIALWSLLGGPELEREYRFAKPRRWRADFAHLPSRTFIEIEGGIYGRGHHVTADGYTSDAQNTMPPPCWVTPLSGSHRR